MKAILISIICILHFIGTSTAKILNIPTDYPSIQNGINAATNGDTILVHPGTYVENIDFKGKRISVASLFIISGNTNYISRTIIDGNQIGSVVMFKNGEDSSSVLNGLTLTNGMGADPYWSIYPPPVAIGGAITCRDSSNPSLRNLVITRNRSIAYGGGIYCLSSNPILINMTIRENSAPQGGGLFCISSNPSLINVNIHDNLAEYGGGLYCADSNPLLTNVLFYQNAALIHGGGIYCLGNSNLIFDSKDRCNIIFNKAGDNGYDIYNNGDLNIQVVADTFTVINPTAYHVFPIDKLHFNILNAKIDQINADLFVDPSGSNDNSGFSPTDPLKTIDYALAKISVDSLHNHTIHLAEGIYGRSTNGERYPLYWRSFISLAGANKERTILDAEGASGILYCYDDNEFRIEGLCLEKVNSEAGGAIKLLKSSPIISNLCIKDNVAHIGGGIYCSQSSPELTDLLISNNESFTGGGIQCSHYSNPIFTDVIISGNRAEFRGGGIYCTGSSSPTLNNVTITGNYIQQFGGGIYCDDNCNPVLKDVIIANNIGCGLYCIVSRSVLENVKITGNSGGGIQMFSSKLFLNNVIIDGNKTRGSAGGGIYCINSTPILKNVTITNNSAGANLGGVGGGIYCSSSDPILINVTLSGNDAFQGGGIYCLYDCNPILVNSILWNNLPQEVYFSSSPKPPVPRFIAIAYSNVEGGESGIMTKKNNNATVYWLDGNLDINPLYVDPDNGDFTLQEGSPCIDSGTAFFDWNGDTLVNLSPVDYFGYAPDMGACEFGIVNSVNNLPLMLNQFKLYENYPNPFNASTTVEYNLQRTSRVTLKIYDILGREVVTLMDEKQKEGFHRIHWDGRDNMDRLVATGLYLYRIDAGDFVSTRKMVVLK